MIRCTITDTQVAVIGAAGFVGSHLTDYLIERRNCSVLAIDNLSVGRREFVHPKAIFEHFDVTGDESHLHRLLSDHRTRFVFNAVAAPYIPLSFARPVYVFNLNALAALKVMNASQESGSEAILQISSAEIYGDTVSGRLDEESPVVPHSTYGVSKAAIDSLVQVRWREAQTPALALRLFNAVGERDVLHPYVIPEIILQLHHNGSNLMLGNDTRRDFQYVGDVARLSVELLERGDFGSVYNLGSGQAIGIYDLTRTIGQIMGYSSITIEEDPSRFRPWEIWHLQSDNTLIENTLGYTPLHRTPLQEALRRTVEYFISIDFNVPWWKNPRTTPIEATTA